MNYDTVLQPLADGPPILADYPEFVEPLQCDTRYLSEPLVADPGGRLLVRGWRWWYNARGIIEMENRLDANATAVVVVHPWGIDDGFGLVTPEPAGVSFFCTPEKNLIALNHIKNVLRPFLDRVRPIVPVLGYSLPGVEDPVRKLLYASIDTPSNTLDEEAGSSAFHQKIDEWSFEGDPIPEQFELPDSRPVAGYFAKAPATHTCNAYDRDFRQHLPMPISAGVGHQSDDLVFYDGEGYEKVRDFLCARGIRHVLLAGYATDMCLARTTCGYENLCRDFNVFIVGDATLATFPGSTTPRFATQTALANAALTQLITQVGWIREDTDE